MPDLSEAPIPEWWAFNLSRRRVLGACALPLVPQRPSRPEFDFWSAEHERVCALLDVASEADENLRDQLLDRSFQLESLIVSTPSSAPSAARAKAKILLWLMEMERHEGAKAMRDVYHFIIRAI